MKQIGKLRKYEHMDWEQRKYDSLWRTGVACNHSRSSAFRVSSKERQNCSKIMSFLYEGVGYARHYSSFVCPKNPLNITSCVSTGNELTKQEPSRSLKSMRQTQCEMAEFQKDPEEC